MSQPVALMNNRDEKGNPAGGHANGLGIDIHWQDEPLRKDGTVREPNGAFVEDVLGICVERLRFYQESRFKCRQNALAITKLEEALHWLEDRTRERKRRGVEGTHQL